jgi:hypothetical protein
VIAGDRLPWMPAARNDRDNFASLTSLTWQVHVYVMPYQRSRPCVTSERCRCTFPWRQEMSRTGLQRNAVYLVRPDGYVGLAQASGGAKSIIDYLDARKLALTIPSC